MESRNLKFAPYNRRKACMRLLPPAILAFLLVILVTAPASPQNAPASKSADLYKPIVDRLQSTTTLAEPEWRFHVDVFIHKTPTSMTLAGKS